MFLKKISPEGRSDIFEEMLKPIKSGHKPDYFLLALIFILTAAGLVILSTASSSLGEIRFNDSYYYLKHQIKNGLIVGIAGFFLGYFIYYQHYRKISLIFLILNIVFLALVFTKFGVNAGGAKRWLEFGPISFQPAEILKISFILYLAALLTNKNTERLQSALSGFLPFLVVSGIIVLLLLLQPATSTVVILLASAFAVYFVSGARLRYIFSLILIFLGVLGFAIYATPYRKERILSFLDANRDVRGSNYQLNQSLIALGSGGLFGIGYGESKNKVSYLPAPIDDSIFAIIGEELGFVGAGGIIVLFAMLVSRLLWIAKNMRNKFGRLLLVGFASIIAFQSLVNMAAISGIIPITGIPLPFISYGGTALAVFLTMSGIIVNISKYT